MPMLKVYNRNVVLPNYDYGDKYWPIVTEIVSKKIGDVEITESEYVQKLLKECFVKLCAVFEKKIEEQRKVSFYIFCQNLHEDSIEIWQKQIPGSSLGDIEEDFAASRRVLKIILEQSCKLKLIGTPNYYSEIESNIGTYIEYLEELLYIGTWCYTLSEYISRSQLFPTSIGVKIESNELNILTYQPYQGLFDFLFHEIKKHNADVVVSDSIIGLKELLTKEFQVDYNILSSFINLQLEDQRYRFGLHNIGNIIEEIHDQYNYDINFIKSFYEGLTVNKANSLSIEDCFLKNQHENRHVFRPILELEVEDEKYHMIGYNKWLESITLLTTNSFPFGHYPYEWKRYKAIKNFVCEVDNSHDKLLENPIKELLSKDNRIFDSNIDSFEQFTGNNINIKKDVGDIDILFLDKKYKVIYICECKHNRSRFDLNNWKRDYSNFKNKYESQLERKVNWVSKNIKVVQNHLKIRYPQKLDFEIDEFETRGIFIINAPTVYMFNGNYRAFTISDIKNLLNEQYVDIKIEFTNEDSGEKILVEHPYFDNLEKFYS